MTAKVNWMCVVPPQQRRPQGSAASKRATTRLHRLRPCPSRRPAAVEMVFRKKMLIHMTIIRTTVNLRTFEARRLMKRGYEILHIETQHRDDGDETTIVWTRPPRPDDIPEHQLPY